MNKLPLPPYGKEYLMQRPSAGIVVAIGPGAWEFANRQTFVCMVLPDHAEPREYRWPSDAHAALVHERGKHNNVRLRSMAEALLLAGATSVVAIREELLNGYDPRVFFDAEVTHAEA